MKRRQAKAVNQTTNELYTQVASNNQPTFSIEITSVDLIHLSSNGFWYEQEDIAKVATYLLNIHGYNVEQQFEVVGGLEQLRIFLDKPKHISVSQGPTFVIYNKGGKHWVVFCITNFENTIVVLYKDSMGEGISDEIRNVLNACFSNITYKNHNRQEQKDECSCGPMSLRNMEIILQSLKDDKTYCVKNFEKIVFCSQSEVEEIKKKFKDNLQKNHSKTLVQDIFALVKDKEYENFKEHLNKFLDECCEYTCASEQMQKYYKVLQEETEKQENDQNYKIDKEAIETARTNFLDENHIKNITEQRTNIPQENGDIVPDIQKKFPAQMEKFTKIFDLLAKSEIDQKLEMALHEISKILDLDYGKVKQFFKTRENKDNTIKQEEKVEPKNIEKIKKDIPCFKSKSSPDTFVKTLEQLLAELAVDVNTASLDPQLSANKLKEYYKNSKEILQLEANFTRVKSFNQRWQNKTEQNILDWAKEKKTIKLQTNELYEAIAVMDRANELVTGGDKLRDTQILSVLIFLQSRENKGKLCQISTGEGKTIIVSLLATLKVLQGGKVDIITSNQVLAKNGLESREHFYGLFNISVATNNVDESYRQGPKTCYTADIVYGTIGNFQFDYLRDSFEGLETRAKRGFNNVILDEVDSMLVDNGGYIAKLAEPFPGIDSLKYVYIKIWQEFYKAEQVLYEEFEKKLKEKAEGLLKKTGVSEDKLQVEYENYRAELFNQLVDELKNKIKASNPADVELIPMHLRQYAASMVDKWIDNAIYAKYQCKENEQYVIKKSNDEDVIVPVDYQNTGVTLKNTIWSNGLHQFVQLKHNLHLTSESLTSSFISNVGYIKLYNNNIFGLTGTLGSVAEQKLLSTIYDVDYARVPTYKQKNFEEIGGVVVKNDQWINCVALESLKLTYKGRSVLIICKTIKDLRDLEINIKALKKLEGFDELKIKTYPDEDSSSIVDEEVNVSEIVLATNIAGRGTDFKTCTELEQNGGLHVCISFLPVNQRVEDQAFGRTSRQGKAGTAQLVIKESDVLELGIEIIPGMNFAMIKRKRDEIEKLRLDKVKNEELAEIDFQDRIFNKFSSEYSRFKQNQIRSPGSMFVIKDLKEYWAFWLQKKKFKNLKLNQVEKEFKSFKQAASSILDGRITHNPYYSILQAEELLGSNQIDEAKLALNRAIDLSKEHSTLLYSAHIKLFEVAIESGTQLRERFKKALKEVIFIPSVQKNETYKREAKSALEAAKKALEKEIHYLEKHFIGEKNNSNDHEHLDFIKILTHNENNLLVKHIVSRLTVLNVFHQHTESLLKQIDDGLKADSKSGLAINTRIPNYLGKLDPKTTNEKELKKAITDSELSEFGLIGLETIYALREVYDVDKRVINRAQGQIGGGLSLLAMGVAFPPSMVAMSPIAGTLISEGICDIAIELISQGRMEFNERAYIKGKCISYGIAIVTLGIGALLKSTKILDKAIKACKGLANMLRKCPYLTSVCEILAKQIDKLALYFEKSKLLIEFSRLSKVEQLRKLEKLKSVGELEKLKHLVGAEKFAQLQHLKDLGKFEVGLSKFQLFSKEFVKIGKETLRGVVGSVVTEKIVTKGLEEILQKVKPEIEKYVKCTIKRQLTEEQLKLVDEKLVNEILTGTHGELAVDIIKEVALGVVRHCNNWKAKITSIAIDTAISGTAIARYTESFCSKLQEQLKHTKHESTNKVGENSDAVVGFLTMQVTEKIYGLIIHLAGKYANTFAVTPIMNKVWSLCEGGGKKIELSAEEQEEVINTFYDIVEDLETLGLKPGASLDEIKQARSRMAFKTHPTRNKDDPQASEKFQRGWQAAERLINLHNNISYRNVVPSKPLMLPNYNQAQQFTPISVDIGLEEAHIGHIYTLSESTKQCIIVKSQETGKTIQKFGNVSKGKFPLVVSYSSPKEGKPGHYSIPEEISKMLKEKNILVPKSEPSYENNCLYDALVPQFNAQGNNISAQQLRKRAEEFSLDNLYYGTLITLSEIFNNPLTRGMYVEMHSALLVGGKRRLTEDHYPSHENKIVANEASKGPLAALRNKLNEYKKKEEQFNNLPESKKRSYIRHTNSQPCFTNVPGKEDMMMGTLEVHFNNGTTLKIITVSGDTPLCIRSALTDTGNLNYTAESHPFIFENEGFTFVDSGKPRGKVYDVYTKNETTQTYTKSCAAQKLFYELGEHMKKNPGLQIKGKIKMAEAFYTPASKSKYTPEQVVLIASCEHCENVLPSATGSHFAGLRIVDDDNCVFSRKTIYKLKNVDVPPPFHPTT